MSTETSPPPTPDLARPRLGDLAWRGVAWALLGCWLVTVAAIAVAGERDSSYGALEDALRHGELEEISVVGNLRHGEVHWQDGWVPRVTDLDGRWPRLDPGPDVEIRHSDPRPYAEIGSWRLPLWLQGVAFFAGIGTFCLLVLGPQPWRATRWAWFWIFMAAPPLGALVFVLLGGGTGLWRPARPQRRLTGAPAFALTFLLSIVGSVLAAWVL